MKNNVLDSVNLHLTLLSPVHIGTGEDYEPSQYIMQDQVLFAFDSAVASQTLSKTQQQELLKIVSQPSRQAGDLLLQLQQFFYNQRTLLAAAAQHKLPVSPGIFSLYQKRIGKAAHRENACESVVNQLEIQRSAFNPYNQHALIPGSSLKGAIRTAVLADLNHTNALKQVQDKRTHKWRQETAHELETRLMQGKFATDPLRLLSISDTTYQLPALFSTDIRFAVNRKKADIKKEAKQNLYQLLECLVPLRYRSFKAQLSLQNLQGISLDKATPAVKLRFKIQDIARACNNFYYPQFKAELALLKEREYVNPAWVKTVEAIFQGTTYQRMQSGQAFLLRVGRHSGAEAVTLDGIRNIKLMQGESKPLVYAPAAKMLRLAAQTEQDRSDMLPFGWVLVELDDKPDTTLTSLLQGWQAKDEQRQQEIQAINEPECWQGARVKYNRANGTLSVEKSGKTANALKPLGEELLNSLAPKLRQQVLTNQFVKVNAYIQDKEIRKLEEV